MTLEEAQNSVGRAVVYDPGYGYGNKRDGTIVSAAGAYARVRYSHNDASIQSTPLDMISLLTT